MSKKSWSILWCDGRTSGAAGAAGAAGRSVVSVVCLVALCALAHGCGYRFAVEGAGPLIGGGAFIDDGPAVDDAMPAVRLVIREFANRTFAQNVDWRYTRYARQEFAVGSGAIITTEDARADYVMTGEIVSVAVPPLTFSITRTRESRVNAVVRVTVTHRRTGDVVWTDTATGVGEFFVNLAPADDTGRDDELQFNRVLRERAIEQAGYDAMQRLASAFRRAWLRGVFSPTPPPSAPKTSAVAPPSFVPKAFAVTPRHVCPAVPVVFGCDAEPRA